MIRNIENINFTFTTHCNMKCPDCCAGITDLLKENKSFYDWDYFVKAAKYLKGIKRITLTGGEASIHPNFEEWVPKMKDLFGCKELALWTNGTMLIKKKEVFKYFDIIHITNYTKDTFSGSPDNTKEIEFIREYLKGEKTQVYSARTTHIPKTNRGTDMCFRGYSDTVEYVDGFLYPCCVGSGLNTKNRITLSDNWREEILKVSPPCNECLFAI